MKYLNFLYKVYSYSMMLIMSSIYTWIFKLKLLLNKVVFGKGLSVYKAIPALQINRHAKKVILGNFICFNNYTDHSWNSKCKLLVGPYAEFRMDDYSGMNGVMINCSQKICIGKHVKIGGGSRISDSNHHHLDWKKRRNKTTDSEAKTAPIFIEDDVFIGASCIIGKGVRIGARSIIAAGSVVVKDIPADVIAGGNPCKIIKKIAHE